MSVVPLLRAAGLTGRGGAGFPTAAKIELGRAQRASLIVNACDGEVGSMKDGYVVGAHREELVHGARLVGLRRTRFAAHRGSATEAALRDTGLDVLSVPDRYVASEESSLASLASGGQARPLARRRPVVHGARTPAGRRVAPALVLNAETVWRIAQIAERGPDWFRARGTATEPGPMLLTVVGAVARPGVYEVAAGASVRHLIERAGGSLGSLQGVNVGGLGGGWLTRREAMTAEYSRAGLSAFGTGPGPGLIRVLDPWSCPLAHVQQMVAYAAGESAGQCGPCMFGLPAVAEDVRLLVTGRVDAALRRRIERRLGQLPARGACRFPDGVAGYVAGALRVFEDHVRLHAQGACTVEQGRAS